MPFHGCRWEEGNSGEDAVQVQRRSAGTRGVNLDSGGYHMVHIGTLGGKDAMRGSGKKR